MTPFSRLALGTVQPGIDHQPILWGLIDLLKRRGVDVQVFRSEAMFPAHDGPGTITGRRTRHLDTWLMPEETCREVFSHGISGCDLGVIEGEFDAARPQPGSDSEKASLDLLCQWLDVPRIVVLDAARLDPCRLGPPPGGASGILLDRVADEEQACRLKTSLEALWGAPVLGWIGEQPALRTIASRLRPGSAPSAELCRALGEQLESTISHRRLLEIAASRRAPSCPARLFQHGNEVAGLRVAVAFDEAFHCYFPDTLDLLELRGAALCDFSPLRSDRLPPETDVVYIGCGHPEEHAVALASNHCLRAALRSFVRRGGRVYAEGGGLAYLCHDIKLQSGKRHSMTGLLPASAWQNPAAPLPAGVHVTLSEDTWLGKRATRLAGYLNQSWCIHPVAPLKSCVAEAERQGDLLACDGIIGSRLHINFAAQEEYLQRFFRPHHVLAAAR